MVLNYSADQIELRDNADRFLRERYTKPARENAERAERGFNPELWKEFAGLGWLAMPFAEEVGGLGMGSVETALLMEQFGRHLVVEPYLSSIVLAGNVIQAGATPAQRTALLAPLIDGARIYALAHAERGASLDPATLTTRAVAASNGWRISGGKRAVLDAAAADALIVSAGKDDGTVGLFLVPTKATGLSKQIFETVDGRLAAHLTLDAAAVDASAQIGDGRDQAAAIALTIDRGIAALSADTVGAMQAALDATVAYTKMRVQFGQPLAANQVVKHRLVEMAVRLEEARSLALAAAIRVGDGSAPAVRERAVSGAKVKVSAAARFVCEQAVQLHGAMGVTDELEIGAYLKRALAFEALFGTASTHLQRYISANANVA